MQKYLFNQPILFSLLCCTISFTSCKKLIEIDPPRDQTETEQVFLSNQSATSAMVGLYSQMMLTTTNLFNGAIPLHAGLAGDELVYNATTANVNEYYLNQITVENSLLRSRFWTSAYSYIYHANIIMEGLTRSLHVSDSVKKRLYGEAEVVRALNYFYLVNLFGDVPLVLSTDYRKNSLLPRAAIDKVYAQIITDLTDAKEKLTADYATAGRVRPNKWAAAALLARAYLYSGNYVAAEAEATSIIQNTTAYQLETNVNNVFLAPSKEAIWQIMPVATGSNTGDGATFIPTSATVRPTYSYRNEFIDAIPAADSRKAAWFKKNTVSGVDYYYPNKYKVRAAAPPYTEHTVVLRLAEQYLIRAEARANQNKLTGGQSAAEDLNVIRLRAGLGVTSATSQVALLDAILAERRVELAGEFGHRWLDIKRAGKADAVLMPLKPATWQSTDVLFPIPFAELQLNPFLTQNEGY